MKFNEQIDRRFDLLNQDICHYHNSGSTFSILEREKDGYAEVKIICNAAPCFHVDRVDKNVFPILQSKRCADHLVFIFDSQVQSWTLHIFEMTRTISEPVWREKILPQFKGGLTNAYAIMGILGFSDFADIQVHCCYRVNKSNTSPVYLRSKLGEPAPPDWLNGAVQLDTLLERSIQNKPIQLCEENGTGQFSL